VGADLVGVIAILVLQSQKGKCVLVVLHLSQKECHFRNFRIDY
jgi:hypothetical protein